MSVKSALKFAPHAILLVIIVIGYIVMAGKLDAAREDASEWRNRWARADTTRQIAEGSVARMAVEVQEISAAANEREAGLRDALADSGRKIVFMARSITIISDSVDVLGGIVASADSLAAHGIGGDFVWGPEEVSLGFVQGSVFCAECIKFEPEVDVEFRPKPLVFDVGLAAHKSEPWEVFVTLQGIDDRFRVEVTEPPEIVDWLREAQEPVCKSKMLGFLPTFCDPLLEAGAGLMLAPDVTFPAGGFAQASIGLGSRTFRATTIATLGQTTSLFAGLSFRLGGK